MPTDKKLFLIDGHSLIFRMYYAFLRRPMINSRGEDTSILFGFLKYLFELIEKEGPTHLAVAFDPPGGTFRKRMYPPYKANRGATPQLVIDALDPLVELCGALRVPVLMVPDYEADDVIGTVAGRTADLGFEVYMVTPDKDYGQLVTDRIRQFKPGKGGENEVLGPAEICAKYGIHSPDEVIDILAICGDTADNVPGVQGVGEVGAGKLVGRYGSVAGIYEHLDELTPRQRASFEAARDHIALSRELVTICRDVPVEFDTDAMALTGECDPSAPALFVRHELFSLLKSLPNAGAKLPDGKPAPVPASGQSQSVTGVPTPDPVPDIAGGPAQGSVNPEPKVTDPATVSGLASAAGRCSVVVDTTGEGIFAGIRTVCIGVLSEGRVHVAAGTPEDFEAVIRSETVEKTGFDLKLQRNVLLNAGVQMRGRLLDIALMHYLVDPERSHKPEMLSRGYLGLEIGQESPAKKEMSLFDEVGGEDSEGGNSLRTEALMKDAAVAFLLCDKVLEDLKKNGMDGLYDGIEEPLAVVLGDMEREGVKVDTGQLRQIACGMGAQLEKIQQNIRDMAGEPDLNVMSTKQIGYVLFEKLALDPKVKKAAEGKRYSYSTDEATLTALSDRHPIIGEILEYRGIRKLLSTYLEPLANYISPRTGRIHTTFNQALTATGRLSSSKPNLQNIPVRTDRGREIRRAFVPGSPDGVILSSDYSQIELRIMAHLSGDEHMVRAFREDRDIHAITASRIFGVDLEDVTPEQRRRAKTANFGMIYGISAFGLAQRLKIPRFEAKQIIEDYFANFPAVRAFMDKAVEFAREKGYAETIFGRRRYLPDITAKNATVRALAERNAVNAPVQGSAADIIKKAMINVARRIEAAGLRSRMILQVHDELVFDAPAEEAEELRRMVIEEMENVIELSVPLTVDCNYGKNWLEAH